MARSSRCTPHAAAKKLSSVMKASTQMSKVPSIGMHFLRCSVTFAAVSYIAKRFFVIAFGFSSPPAPVLPCASACLRSSTNGLPVGVVPVLSGVWKSPCAAAAALLAAPTFAFAFACCFFGVTLKLGGRLKPLTTSSVLATAFTPVNHWMRAALRLARPADTSRHVAP